MLPKENRIKKKKDFEAIFKNSKSFRNNLFIVKISKNGLDFNRIGCVVSKKVSTKSTIRNKIRRRIFSVCRLIYKDFNDNLDIVFIALPEISKKDFIETKTAILNILFKNGLIKK